MTGLKVLKEGNLIQTAAALNRDDDDTQVAKNYQFAFPSPSSSNFGKVEWSLQNLLERWERSNSPTVQYEYRMVVSTKS